MTGNPQRMVNGVRIRVAPMGAQRVQAARAAERLNAELIALAVRGQRPRCGDPGAHRLWTSENARDRALAARWCAGCPVTAACAAAADARDERFGVWGGVDRTPRQGQSR